MAGEPRMKPDLVDCPCGCGLVGRPRAKQWSDGVGPHVRLCECRRCKGGRTRARSRRQEHRLANAVGGQREPLSGGLSGVDVRSPLVEFEHTANERLVAGLKRWWEAKQTQAKLRRLFSRTHSDACPVFVARWGNKDRLWVMRAEDAEPLLARANAQATELAELKKEQTT